VSAKPTLVSLILDATAAGRAMLTAASAAAQKTLLSLTKSDVGLPNVDNTSDANKPVSTAQQTAIDAKIGGTLGATDNRIPRSDGAGGLTLQASGITITDTNQLVLPSSIGSLTIDAANGAATFSQTVAMLFQTSNAIVLRHGPSDAVWARSTTGAITTISPAGFGALGLLNASNAVGAYLAIPAAGTLAIRNAAHGAANLTAADITASGLMCAGIYTVGTLPSASANASKIANVTDSSVTSFRSIVAGGGANRVMVFSDGTNWLVI
jgi:hypothetical protein